MPSGPKPKLALEQAFLTLIECQQLLALDAHDAEALWQFSLAYYPPRQAALLRCQDQYGARINLLLLLLWQRGERSRQNRTLPPTSLAAAAQTAAQLQTLTHCAANLVEAIAQLRRYRRQLSKQTESELYQRCLAAELAAERTEQAALWACYQTLSQPDPEQLLSHYCQQLQLPTHLLV